MNTEQFTAIIVDDEPEAINNLKGILEHHSQIRIIGSYKQSEEAIENILDEIELAKTLKRIQQKDPNKDYDKKLTDLFHELSKPRQLKFNTSTGFVLIDPAEIIYCQASRNYCEIFLTDGRREVVTKNMNQVGKLLPENQFFRISRFNIINLNFLRKVERKNHECILKVDNETYKLKGTLKNLKTLEVNLDWFI